MCAQPTVHIVDDDQMACQSVAALVSSMDLVYVCYGSAEEFLENYLPDLPGCLVTDFRMLGMSGLDLQKKLAELQSTLPIILITAYASIPVAVESLKEGAYAFLEKSCLEHDLGQAIQGALNHNRQLLVKRQEQLAIEETLASLSANEQEVLRRIAQGQANKEIALALGVSVRTVEDRRRRVMQKIESKSFADLMRLVVKAEQFMESRS